MYTTSGNKILKGGKEFIIRGYNLGNWMNLERFMFGFPGVDHLFRRNLKYYGGEEKYDYFFDLYYKTYFQEKDAKFLKKLGCNALRIPFNYRVFEDDLHPFVFSSKAFSYIDHVIDLCAAEDIGVIIDYHSAQGFQSWAHCVDNITGETPIYFDKQCQDRFVALWEFVAEHYKDNENIICYDLMNEPTPTPMEYENLRVIYRNAIAAIRKIDKKHIISIEGTAASTNFEAMYERFDDNMAFTPHIYPQGPKYTAKTDRAWRKEQLIREIDFQNQAAAALNVPVWYGETGLKTGPTEKDRLELLDLSLEIFNERGYGWTLWTYKDMKPMGLVVTKDDSPWQVKTKKYADLKEKYQLDQHYPVRKDTTEVLFSMIEEDFDATTPVIGDMWSTEAEGVERQVWVKMVNALAKSFAPGFAKIFADMNNDELAEMVHSFDLDNCIVKQHWYDIIARRMAE